MIMKRKATVANREIDRKSESQRHGKGQIKDEQTGGSRSPTAGGVRGTFETLSFRVVDIGMRMSLRSTTVWCTGEEFY